MIKETQMLVAKNLRKVRREKDYTQTELAYLSGVSITSISLIESGQNENPRLDTILLLARALKTPAYIFFMRHD